MRVLGLDPSLTAFGWAIHDTSGKGYTRCAGHGRFSTPSKMVEPDRYTAQSDSLRSIIQQHQPDAVALESPVFGERYSEGMYALYVVVSQALRLERMDTVLWSPGQIKAFAKELLDRPSTWGSMTKSDMVEAARWDTREGDYKLGRIRNHNEADAYLCSVLGARFWQLQRGEITEDTLTEREHIQFLHTHTYQRGKKAGKTERKGTLYRKGDRYFLWSQEDSPWPEPKRKALP